MTATIVCGVILASYAGFQLAWSGVRLANWFGAGSLAVANFDETPEPWWDDNATVAEVLNPMLEVLLAPFLPIAAFAAILAGGVQMARKRTWWLGLTACILTAAPCNCPCCLLGVPIGIWGLTMLCLPTVRESFTS